MRETPKLFQLWPRPTYATSGHMHTPQSFSSFKLSRIYIAALVVIVVSAVAWIIGSVVLALHWTQVTGLPLHTATVGNTALHASLTTDSDHTTTVSTETAPTTTSNGTTSTSAVSQTSTSASTAGQAGTQANTATTVTVNGENIPVPDNGSVSKKITNDNGTTSVHVSSGSQGSSESNVSVQVNSTSSSTSSGGSQ